MDKKRKSLIFYDREENGLSYRKLARKYGMAHSSIFAMLNNNKKPKAEKGTVAKADPQEMPDDIAALKEALRKARLKIELQDLMIDIASKELGVDIRKKSGTRQSE